MYKVIIAGGRDFGDYGTLRNSVDEVLRTKQYRTICIVSGAARGADTLGETYANVNSYLCKVFPADWKKHGKAAGYIRNKKMAECADCLVAFWDGKSKGTKHMIDLAKERGLEVYVFNYLGIGGKV